MPSPASDAPAGVATVAAVQAAAAVEVSRDRLNLSELARLLLAGQSRSVADRSAVRLTRNARGDTQIEVVVGVGEEGINDVLACAERACEVYDRLRELYPLAQAAPSEGAS